jgi:UDP-glucose 4-epimerase
MRALVTGAAGFIGSHLCDALINRGFEVVGLDNLSVGRIENLNHLDKNKLEFFEIDVSRVSYSDSPFDNLSFDFIFHLAALADVVPSIKNPTSYFNSNVEGTLKILEFARECKPRKFVYAASSSCYGIPRNFPTNEEEPISPEYPYALTKFLGEELVLHWGKVYQLPVLSLRLFNVYGPRARTSGTYGAVFGVFLAQKQSGKPLTIVGDGCQTRDFTYVTDVVDAFITAALSPVRNEVFNVGSGGTYSINQLVEILGGERVNIPKRPGEPDCTFADISKIQRQLGWNPKVSFETGVELMISHLEDWKNAPVWTPETIERETELWFKFLSDKSAK